MQSVPYALNYSLLAAVRGTGPLRASPPRLGGWTWSSRALVRCIERHLSAGPQCACWLQLSTDLALLSMYDLLLLWLSGKVGCYFQSLSIFYAKLDVDIYLKHH